jgi:hypothetical protein
MTRTHLAHERFVTVSVARVASCRPPELNDMAEANIVRV